MPGNAIVRSKISREMNVFLFPSRNKLTHQPQSQCPSWGGRWCAGHLWSARCPPAGSCRVLPGPHGTRLRAWKTRTFSFRSHSLNHTVAQHVVFLVTICSVRPSAPSEAQSESLHKCDGNGCRASPAGRSERKNTIIEANSYKILLTGEYKTVRLQLPAMASCGHEHPLHSPPCCWC